MTTATCARSASARCERPEVIEGDESLGGGVLGLVVTPVVVLTSLFPLAWEDRPGALSLVPVVIFGGFIFEVIVGALIGFLLGPLIEKRLDTRSRVPQQGGL